MDTLRTAVSQSSTFQTWVGAANATGALARVYEIAEDDWTLPCAVLDQGEIESESVALGVMERRGTLTVLLVSSAVTASQTSGEQFRTFMNTAGAVIAEIEEQAGSGGLNVVASRRDEPPSRASIEEKAVTDDGDVYMVQYMLDYMGA
jgi:hypothetical protein